VPLVSKEIERSVEREVVDTTAAKGAFRAIRLQVRRGGALLGKVVVVYADGSTHVEERRINLLPGDRTRPIGESRQGKFVDRVELHYVTKVAKGAAKGDAPATVLEVSGLQGSAEAQAERSPGPVSDAVSPPTTAIQPVTPASRPAPPTAPPDSQRTAAVPAPPAPVPNPVAAPVPAIPSSPMTGPASRSAVTGDHGAFLGRQTLALRSDRGRIRIGPDRGDFAALRLRAIDGGLRVSRVRVLYAQGEPDELALEAILEPGVAGERIAIKGGRDVREIEIAYAGVGKPGARTTIEVFGEFSNAYLGELEKLDDPRRWLFLHAQSAALKIGVDADVFHLPRNRGFRRLRVDVRERAVALKDFTLVFDGDKTEVYAAEGNRTRVSAGGSYTFEIKGAPRPIRQVRVGYRSRFNDRDAKGPEAAVVELWGRY
jgi:hypothetical protein